MAETPFRVLTRSLPAEANLLRDDPVLSSILARRLPKPARAWLEPQLDRMGADVPVRVEALSRAADRWPPVLSTHDRFGGRIDEIVYHPSYRELERIAYGSGMVGLKYEPAVQKDHPGSRQVMGFALTFLYGQSECGQLCPVCMTDGVARVVELFGTAEQKARIIPPLAARELATLHRGAMFLTEKQGGSDVGAVATRAVREGGRFRLFGEKWFCSNVDAEAILTLARPEGAPPGTKGLGLFFVRRDLPDGRRNGLRIDRIKDKLGVRSMATGEVVLDGTLAEPVGPLDAGFKCMAEMLNLSRLYNAFASISIARRAIWESTRYLRSRSAFGRTALDLPLVRETLADLNAEEVAAKHLLFQLAQHLDRADAGEARDKNLVRILTPLAKYTTAKMAIWAASEGIELNGGNGYIEESCLPRLLRDAQVLPVWEGTTNILVLDALRAARKEAAHTALLEEVVRRCEAAPRRAADVAGRVTALARVLGAQGGSIVELQPDRQARPARRWTDRLALVYSLSLLVEASGDAGVAGEIAHSAARRLVQRHLDSGVELPADAMHALVDQTVPAAAAG